MAFILCATSPVLSRNSAKALEGNEEAIFLAHKAAEIGEADALRKLLEQGLSPDVASPDGWSLLTRGAANGQSEIVKILLEAGADIDFSAENGVTPLVAAATARKTAAVEILLRNGADTEIATSDGVTPLEIATANGDLVVLNALLDAGAIFQQNNALLFAVQSKKGNAIDALVNAGADPGAPGPDGITPLALAIILGEQDIVRKLVLAGANVKDRSYRHKTPIELAATNERHDIAQFLSKGLGLEVNGSAPGPDEKTLAFAILKWDATQVAQLLKGGIDPNERIDGIWTPLMVAAMSDDPEKVQALLDAGADVNAKTRSGYTALHVAALRGNARVAKKLTAAGANAAAGTEKKVTPADMARETKNPSLAADLMRRTGKGSLARRNFAVQVQSLLYLRGYRVGSIDGAAGPQTSKAIQQFQWGLHRRADGRLDEKIVRELWDRHRKTGPIGSNWAAIVVDGETDLAAGQFRAKDKNLALSSAIKNCLTKGSRCENRRVFKDQCVALARDGDGWGTATRPTIWAARKAAIASCAKVNGSGCYLTFEFCSDGSFHRSN